jgi:uncharacterized protein
VKNTLIDNEFLPDLLGSKLRAKVLGWLFTHPDESYYVRQLTELIQEDSTNLSRELARLEQMGILSLTPSGNQKYYQSNQKCPIFSELQGLMMKTFGIENVLRAALSPASKSAKRINLALVFGSFVKKGEDGAGGIDILIVGEVSFDEVTALFAPAVKALSREIKPVVYTVPEFQEKIKSDYHMVYSVLGGEKIFLVGEQNDLLRFILMPV